MSRAVDLNADVGESFGAYTLGRDEDLIPLVSSVNIACGFHAGDPGTMRRTVQLAMKHGVPIGAHPGYPDLPGFGRRAMSLSSAEIEDVVTYQIGALAAFVQAEGGRLHHVKPHGALYNVAAVEQEIASAIARAVAKYDDQLLLFGLAGSKLLSAGQAAGLRVVSEVFADRQYNADGSLVARSQPNSTISDVAQAAARMVRLLQEGEVVARDGSILRLTAETICLHGDHPDSVEFAQQLRAVLGSNGIVVQAPSR